MKHRPRTPSENQRLAKMGAVTKPPEEPNLALFYQLSPQIQPMARAMGVSKPTIYNIIEPGQQKYKPSQPTIQKFNAYLRELLANRLRWAQKNARKRPAT